MTPADILGFALYGFRGGATKARNGIPSRTGRTEREMAIASAFIMKSAIMILKYAMLGTMTSPDSLKNSSRFTACPFAAP